MIGYSAQGVVEYFANDGSTIGDLNEEMLLLQREKQNLESQLKKTMDKINLKNVQIKNKDPNVRKKHDTLQNEMVQKHQIEAENILKRDEALRNEMVQKRIMDAETIRKNEMAKKDKNERRMMEAEYDLT